MELHAALVGVSGLAKGALIEIDMVARHGLSYPFDLVEDKNSRGRAWLQNVLAEPA
jgi:hypothetical protein